MRNVLVPVLTGMFMMASAVILPMAVSADSNAAKGANAKAGAVAKKAGKKANPADRKKKMEDRKKKMEEKRKAACEKDAHKTWDNGKCVPKMEDAEEQHGDHEEGGSMEETMEE